MPFLRNYLKMGHTTLKLCHFEEFKEAVPQIGQFMDRQLTLVGCSAFVAPLGFELPAYEGTEFVKVSKALYVT